MNLTINLSGMNMTQPVIEYLDPVVICANYSHTIGLWVNLLLALSILAIFWFGPRALISRWVKNELAIRIVGTSILVMIGVLAALLQANLTR